MFASERDAGRVVPFRLTAAGFVRGCLLVSALVLLWRLGTDLAEGGSAWRQGDWLVHSLSGEIRRGPFGSLFLRASDALAVSPVGLVILVQALLVAGLYGLLWGLVGQGEMSPLRLVLLCSPAFPVLFWAGDPNGAFRKELIIWMAMALALYAPLVPRWRDGLCLLSAVVFAIGCLGHEAFAVLIPAYCLVIWLVAGERRGVALVSAGVAVAAAVAAVGYALVHTGVEDAGALCQALVDRGVPQDICRGSIRWLAIPFGDVLRATGGLATDPTEMVVFALAYGLVLAPVVLVLRCLEQRRLALWALGVAFLPVARCSWSGSTGGGG